MYGVRVDPGASSGFICSSYCLSHSAAAQDSHTFPPTHEYSFSSMLRLAREALNFSVDRAQTVLRYWNWSLSSAMTPALMKAIRDGEEQALDEYSVPQRVALLALSGDFNR